MDIVVFRKVIEVHGNKYSNVVEAYSENFLIYVIYKYITHSYTLHT